nr:Type 1 glutamine amidotransferase-like domain-containing protein [Kofleriaceae bacterium]
MLRELSVKGPVAMVTAGWQEREGEPGVVADPGVPVVDLALHRRADEVLAGDRELATAYKARQVKLKLMQDFYRVRLDHAEASLRAVQVRSAPADVLAEEWAASLELVRYIDRDHLVRCRAVHQEFDAKYKPRERFAMSKHLAELKAVIAPTDALVIAGGHVAVLLNRLALFGAIALVGDRPIVAWSAGAMALTERVVLFHDDPPHGKAISEILDAGLGLVPGLVVLPGARSRLRLEDSSRVTEFAERYTPAACVALDRGTRVWIDKGRIVKADQAKRLTDSGVLSPVERERPERGKTQPS